MKPQTTVLIVDDEANMRRILEVTLKREGYGTLTAENGAAALDILQRYPVQIVLTDLKMPGIDGMTLLRECVTRFPDIPLIMLTAHGTVETAVEAMKLGAFDYVTKPFDIAEIRQSLDKAGARYSVNQRSYRGDPGDRHGSDITDLLPGLPTDTLHAGGIIASSESMRRVLSLVDRVADSPSTILITGESGTGKELIAGMIHGKSSRRRKPFISVNCAAIPETLLESEFFGHERGAFTGAVMSKPGRFELANGGTLFLDEISEISPEIQVKLLRAIQERRFERVGGIRTLEVDVRLIAATNLDLAAEVARGRFRSDLYYRLNVVPIHLPPLRNRPEDIPPLVRFFIDRMNRRLNRSVETIADDAMKELMTHRWNGNIRELENVIERAVLLCQNRCLDRSDLNLTTGSDSHDDQENRTEMNSLATPSAGTFRDIVQTETDRVEQGLLEDALVRTGGNITHAAKLLGLSRKGLQLKLKRLDIDPRHYRRNP
ncbi:sigma-54-dependent Fis family transcriptional regulator [bacterium]|nr:sigma-54-dependent Fis family transcriptional regulator [candidate division CSSED10-310 bacterium]